MALHRPDQEITSGVALAWHPRWWVLLPQVDRRPPDGWRGGWAVTWWFVHVFRWWRYA
ncbi:MAG: hypothetical protein LW862_17810 [Rubrivivax sp.]|nr:hypothetical protein [Rubrivivax sp.]